MWKLKNIMELSEKDIKDLKQEIQHIFDSGANEIRVFEMVKMFTERRFVKSLLPVVSHRRELLIAFANHIKEETDRGFDEEFMINEFLSNL